MAHWVTVWACSVRPQGTLIMEMYLDAKECHKMKGHIFFSFSDEMILYIIFVQGAHPIWSKSEVHLNLMQDPKPHGYIRIFRFLNEMSQKST